MVTDMKRKTALLIILGVFVLAFAGCGKGKTVGDNLINEEGSDLSGDLQQLISESQSQDESEFSSLYEGETLEEETDSGFAQIDTDVSGNSVSENGENVGQPAISDSVPESFPVSSTYTADEDNHFIFSNISGVNLDDLYISTSTGLYEAQEILGDKKLKDGSQTQYEVYDMDNLKKSGTFTLNVTGGTKKNEVIDFGSIEIIDATHMNIVLAKNKDGYYMYIE